MCALYQFTYCILRLLKEGEAGCGQLSRERRDCALAEVDLLSQIHGRVVVARSKITRWPGGVEGEEKYRLMSEFISIS